MYQISHGLAWFFLALFVCFTVAYFLYNKKILVIAALFSVIMFFMFVAGLFGNF
jgi:hypothetical protein